MIFPAEIVKSIFEKETIDDKARYIRFEYLSELFTYVALIVGVFLTLLPFQYSFDRQALYVLIFIILTFSVVWFRLMPKKYSGRTKNLIYYATTIVFIGVVVYLTRGIQSQVIFLFYLSCLAVVASMRLKETILFTLATSLVILSQAFIRIESLSFSESLSLATLHIWGLVSITVFGYFIFGEERRTREQHKRSHVEKAKEINKIKDEYVFIISSKLASPVVTLREYVKYAMSGKSGKFSTEQKDIVEKIEENSRQLELLVGDLMDLSKIESGSLSLNLEKVDLGQVLGAVLSDFSVKASERNISILFEDPKEKVYVKADSARLHEVVSNLVDNAIKFSFPDSRVKVSFSQEDNFAQVKIEDRGRGISEEGQQHLFEKFYRSPEAKNKVKGSGLGLFVSKQLIQRQGGGIWVKSQLGVGSTFSFKIPLA